MRAASVVERALEGGRREVSSLATFADGEATPVYLRFPDAGPLPAAGDAFLPMLLAPAMALHEDLVIDAPVSRSLLEAANERVGPVLAGFHPGLARVEIRAAEVVDDGDAVAPPGVAAFFSGGLDSCHTFMRHQARLTHLVFLHGFDVHPDDAAVLAELAARARALTDASGLALIEIHCNGRRKLAHVMKRRLRPTHPRMNFAKDLQLGSLLVSFAQGLVGHVGRVILASSWHANVAQPKGSHPWIEPNWASRRLAIELDGWEQTRIEKTRQLAAGRPDLLRRVRVCWARPHGVENCGRCGKCIRLRLELQLAGVAPGDQPFARPMSHGAIRRSLISGDTTLWHTILEEARACGDTEAARTVETLLDQRRDAGREFKRAVRHLSRRLGRRLAPRA